MNIWFQGLLTAVISGSVTALAGVLTSPETCDLSPAGLRKMGMLAVAGALIGVVAFLKQSPLPKKDDGKLQGP